jgi:hypothetical protein
MTLKLPDPKKKTWSQAEGRAMIAAWRRSGLTLNQFALRNGTTEQRLGHWRKKLEDQTRSPSVTFAPAVMPAGHEVRAIVQGDGITVAIEGADPDYVVAIARGLGRQR